MLSQSALRSQLYELTEEEIKIVERNEMAGNKKISAGKTDPVEMLLKIGGEGGSLSIRRFRATDGTWKFIFITDESTLADFLEEEDQIELVKKYSPVNSFEEALQLMNKYPWHEMHLITMHPEYAGAILLEKKERSTVKRSKSMNAHGQLTAELAQSIREELSTKGYDVYCGHGKAGPLTGKIVSSINEPYKRGDELGHLDIAIVKKDTNQAVVLIEIEETNDKPKTLFSDVFGALMGNFVSLPHKGKIVVGSQTTLIIFCKGENHKERIKHIEEKAKMARCTLGTGNSEIGNIVIEPFTNEGELKKRFMEQIKAAMQRNV